jgi:hypothetical protein
VVHLDLVDAATLRSYPARSRRFIVYNPTDDTRSVRLALRALRGRSYRVSTAGRVVDRGTLLRGVPLTLPGRSFQTIELEEVTE